MAVIKEITGRRFHQLVAIKFISREQRGKHFYHFWEFLCDCGNIKKLGKSSVMMGSVKSCGCLHKKNVFRKNSGEATLTKAFHQYKRGARKRSYSWNLSKEEFKILTSKNCYYCDAPPSNEVKSYCNNGSYIYSGIDRVVNTKGYTWTNCIPCCKFCNTAKADLSLEEFVDNIKKLNDHLRERGL